MSGRVCVFAREKLRGLSVCLLVIGVAEYQGWRVLSLCERARLRMD